MSDRAITSGLRAKLKKINTRFCPEKTALKKGKYCSDCGCLIPTKAQKEGLNE